MRWPARSAGLRIGPPRRTYRSRAVIELVGDHVLMFESDYPHPETIFPDHADAVIAWRRTLGEPATQKLMWENAARFFRLTSTPWDSAATADQAAAR